MVLKDQEKTLINNIKGKRKRMVSYNFKMWWYSCLQKLILILEVEENIVPKNKISSKIGIFIFFTKHNKSYVTELCFVLC